MQIPCEGCGRVIFFSSKQVRHIIKKAPDADTDITVERIRCPECGYENALNDAYYWSKKNERKE